MEIYIFIFQGAYKTIILRFLPCLTFFPQLIVHIQYRDLAPPSVLKSKEEFKLAFNKLIQ